MSEEPSVLRTSLPWVLGSALVVLGVLLYLWWTAPEHNPLPDIYRVL